jgi:3-deoxy-7-phosphoheptulonate synthase
LPGDRDRDRDRDGAGYRLRPVSHSAFRESVTRMLLSSDGSTTRLLEATVGPLRLRVLHQAVGTAAHSSETIRTALGLAPEAQIINRCSALVDADSRPVSLNHVVAPFVPHSRLGDIVSGTAAGIGPELARQNVEHRRELLACGLARWPDTPGPRPAAAKVYVIWQGEERLMYIREMFNPDVIPAATTAAVSVLVPPPVPAVEQASGRRTPSQYPDTSHATVRRPGWRGSDAAGARRAPLEAMPGLVTAAECDALRSTLALAAVGRGFVVQVGDEGAETFDRCTQDAVESGHALIRLLATAAGYGMGVPVAAVGRITGRWRAEPQRADLASSMSESPGAENPERMLQAYLHSAAMLHALNNADRQADVRWIRWLRDEFGHRKVNHPQAEAVVAEMDFALQFGASGAGWPRTFVSHEALSLDYERALVRADGAGRVHGSSGHLLWIGEHARDAEGAHATFAASIVNPVAVRLGPSADPGEVLDLCRRLDPEREPGRLTFVVAMGGADRLSRALPELLGAVRDAGHPVVWICDPVGAGADTAASGRRARHMDEVSAEITAFYDAHADAGTHAGGLHLEAAAEDVAVDCDRSPHPLLPLHPLQALECVLHAATLRTALQRTRSAPAAFGDTEDGEPAGRG